MGNHNRDWGLEAMTGQNCQPEGCQESGYITDYRESFRVIAAQAAATAPGSRWHYLQSGAQHRDGALRVRMVSGAGLAGEQDAPDEGHEVGRGEVIADGAAALSAGEQPADLIPLTVPEIKRLLGGALARPHLRGHAARWVAWRRRHQARSRWFHQRNRLSP